MASWRKRAYQKSRAHEKRCGDEPEDRQERPGLWTQEERDPENKAQSEEMCDQEGESRPLN